MRGAAPHMRPRHRQPGRMVLYSNRPRVDHYREMTELAASMYLPRQSLLPRVWRLGAAAVALGVLALGLVGAVQSIEVSFALALAGGLALTGLLLLPLRHFDTAVAIGLLLMGVVRFEPAPPDLVFARSEERRVGKECRSRWS